MSILRQLQDINVLLNQLIVQHDDARRAALTDDVNSMPGDAPIETQIAFALLSVEASAKALRERLNIPTPGVSTAQLNLSLEIPDNKQQAND